MQVKVMKYRFQSENYKILSPSDKGQEDILTIIQEEQEKAKSNDIITPEIIYRVGKKIIKTEITKLKKLQISFKEICSFLHVFI